MYNQINIIQHTSQITEAISHINRGKIYDSRRESHALPYLSSYAPHR
jgi:hypothetical protein